jgi:hypothetical protein
MLCRCHLTPQYVAQLPLLLLLLLPLLLLLQVSGQAQYTDDVPLPPNTLHAAFVTSSKPHAKLLKVRRNTG